MLLMGKSMTGKSTFAHTLPNALEIATDGNGSLFTNHDRIDLKNVMIFDENDPKVIRKAQRIKATLLTHQGSKDPRIKEYEEILDNLLIEIDSNRTEVSGFQIFNELINFAKSPDFPYQSIVFDLG